jgi:hypothetical protein
MALLITSIIMMLLYLFKPLNNFFKSIFIEFFSGSLIFGFLIKINKIKLRNEIIDKIRKTNFQFKLAFIMNGLVIAPIKYASITKKVVKLIRNFLFLFIRLLTRLNKFTCMEEKLKAITKTQKNNTNMFLFIKIIKCAENINMYIIVKNFLKLNLP